MKSINNGAGPKVPYPPSGWDFRPFSHWDFTEGRRPA